MNLRILIVALLFAVFSGCAGLERVQPWQRGELARKAMRPDAYPNDAFLDEHLYFSKESATGGQGIGGGGCGCN